MQSSSNSEATAPERDDQTSRSPQVEVAEQPRRQSVGTEALRDDELAYSMPCTD